MAIIIYGGREVDVEYRRESFASLLRQYVINVPSMQRDYAYGRDIKQDNIKSDKKNVSGDETTKIVREGLIQCAKDALVDNSDIDLNFIYGVKHDDGKYFPIDGQQRLTTLFLLYWYIAQRRNDVERLDRLKEKFSYTTRDTSKRFCEYICKVLYLDFEKETIADQIEECSWFASTFKYDPTVWSMLVVINSIHSLFKDATDNELDDYATRLEADTCPIKIETLTVESLGNEEDLYIKMNGRGKQLTDFEIFKSQLQQSEELKAILGGNPTPADLSAFIGRFNTDYCQLFNDLINDPLNVETALFAYVKNYLMCRYFAKISADGIREKDYRDECGKFRFFNGKVLFKFFSTLDHFGLYSKLGMEDQGECNVLSFREAENVLSKMYSYYQHGETPEDDECYYSIAQRINNLLNDNRSLMDDFTDFSIFIFVSKYDFPSNDSEKEAFNMWKRFVYNISSNADLSGSNESLIKIVRVVIEAVESIQSYHEKDILNAICQAGCNSLLRNASLINPQFDEERKKAELILSDYDWKKRIIDAEDYYEGGQIGFLIYMSSILSGVPDKDEFLRVFNASKMVWGKDKRVCKTEFNSIITKAFLSVSDSTSTNTSHLLKKNNRTYVIPMDNYTELFRNYRDQDEEKDRKSQWEIICALLNQISAGYDVIDAANVLINNRENLDYWKECLVANDLFDGFIGIDSNSNYVYFSNKLYLVDNDFLLLSKKSVRSSNMSLKTYMLYKEMINRGLDAKLNTFSTQLMLEDDIPLRTINYNSHTIGYNNVCGEYIILETGAASETIPGILDEIMKL